MSKASNLYGQEYRDKYLRDGATPLGKAIYSGRWALVLRYVDKGTLLDYGSGPGLFNAHGPSNFTKVNFDINPTCGFTEKSWLNGTKVDVLTMWDSIEHIPDFFGEIRNVNADWLFLTTPNLEAVDTAPILWKHYRPKEHLFYFDRHSLEVIMDELGYQLVEFSFHEGRLRDSTRPMAIITGVFKKR